MQEKKRGANTQRQVLKQLKLVSMQEKKRGANIMFSYWFLDSDFQIYQK